MFISILFLLPVLTKCDTQLRVVKNPVYIKSPGYPNKPYGNDIKCVWRFKNDKSPNVLTFILLDLDTEEDADFVEVRDVDKDGFLLGKYSGNTIGSKAVVTTTESSMWVKFQSDFEDNRKGFRAVVYPGRYIIVFRIRLLCEKQRRDLTFLLLANYFLAGK